jgi:SOS-response transcriptional repressor LexA
MKTNLTIRQQAIVDAIEAGHTTTRAIARATGLKSNSDVARQLEELAAGGHIVMRQGPRGATVARGADFCAAWDSACRLAGNPDA